MYFISFFYCKYELLSTSHCKVYITRHDNSWRQGRHASGTKSRKMRNHNAEDQTFASFLTFKYTYEATMTLFFVMASILRLPNSLNSINVGNKQKMQPFFFLCRSDQFDITVIEEPINMQNYAHSKVSEF